MSAIRAIIVDDEPLAVDGIRRQCKASGKVEVVGTADDGRSALLLIERMLPQAVFLDIAMPGLTGLEVARALRAQAKAPLITLVTAHDHFATEAFDLAVVDYVLKPIDPPRFQRAIDRLHDASGETAGAPAHELWVPHRGSLVRVPIDQIDRIEAERDYVRIFADGRSYLQRITLSDLLDRLGDRFIRVHRSAALPIETIASLRHCGGGAWVARCHNGADVALGRTYLADVRSRLGV